jgi:hypothetical protein
MKYRLEGVLTGNRVSSMRMVAAAVSVALVGSTLVLGFSGPAMASAASCGTPGSGITGVIANGGGFDVETTWIKKPPGCNDFNVTSTNDPIRSSDGYSGWYKKSGVWTPGASGVHLLSNGSHGDVALVTSVATGTTLTIISEFNLGDTVHVDR